MKQLSMANASRSQHGSDSGRPPIALDAAWSCLEKLHTRNRAPLSLSSVNPIVWTQLLGLSFADSVIARVVEESVSHHLLVSIANHLQPPGLHKHRGTVKSAHDQSIQFALRCSPCS